jgi:hypothetical protein
METFDGTNFITITDTPTEDTCRDTVTKARNAGALRAEIRVSISRLADVRSALEAQGYAFAGTAQTNEDGRTVTRARFLFALRASTSDGLAVPTPQLPSSHFEQQAIAEMKQTLQPLSLERLAQLAAMGRQDV